MSDAKMELENENGKYFVLAGDEAIWFRTEIGPYILMHDLTVYEDRNRAKALAMNALKEQGWSEVVL